MTGPPRAHAATVPGAQSAEQPASPENPRHIDARVTAISAADLSQALTAGPTPTTLAALRDRLTLRAPVWDLADWARGVRGTAEEAQTIRTADTLVTDGIDVTGAHLGRSRRYGFHYLRWLDPLARAYALTGDPRYPHTFSQRIRDWESVRDGLVGQWPGLDIIWYSLGCWCRSSILLPALATFGGALDDDGWLTTITTVVGGSRWMLDEHTAFRHGNWQLVAATQLLHAGYVLPDLAEASAWRDRGLALITEHLALDFYPDGGHYERSPGYHQMCLRNLQLAAAADRQYGCGELAAHPKLHQAHRWIGQLTTSAGWAPAFQDSPLEWPADVLLRGAWLLEDAALLRTARQVMPADLVQRELACLPREAAEWAQSTSLPADGLVPPTTSAVVLPDSSYTILTTVQDVRAVINHGPHIEHELESHSHRAVLDLVLDRAGVPLLWEAGGPPHYDDPHYQSWFQAGAGHNAVTREDHILATERRAASRHLTGAGFATFHGSHHGYGLPQHRTVISCAHLGPMLIVRDRAEQADASDEFKLRWHAPKTWTPEDSGSVAEPSCWSTPDLVLVTCGHKHAMVEHLGEARLPGAYGSSEYGRLSTLTLTGSTGCFDTVLLPRETETEPPAISRSEDRLVVQGERTEVTVAERWVAQHTADGAGHRALLGWGVQQVEWDGLSLSVTSSIDLTWECEGPDFTAVLTCAARCTVSIGGRLSALRLDGVELEPGRGGPGNVVLPYPGTWTVTGRRHD